MLAKTGWHSKMYHDWYPLQSRIISSIPYSQWVLQKLQFHVSMKPAWQVLKGEGEGETMKPKAQSEGEVRECLQACRGFCHSAPKLSVQKPESCEMSGCQNDPNMILKFMWNTWNYWWNETDDERLPLFAQFLWTLKFSFSLSRGKLFLVLL